MRAAFVETLVELAADDDRIVLLTGDLGFMALEPFRDAHPERFFNVGVAEQNMLGMATGLAEAGYTPYCYSIATFASLRGIEFFRNGAVWHNLPVRLVGMGGGFEYGSAGFTHHALEDVGVMRLFPRVTVVAPADAMQAREATKYVQSRSGPVYIRLGKDERRRVPGLDGAFDPSRVGLTRDGDAGLVLAMGGIAAEAAAAVDALAARGLSCTFGVVSTIAPPPVDHLRQLLGSHAWVASVEAHVRCGGLGSILDDTITASRRPTPHLHCAVDDPLLSCELGDEAFFLDLHRLSAPTLENRFVEFAETVA